MFRSAHATVSPPAEGFFRASDDTRLFYRAWLPPTKATRAILLFHRGHEHSGRFAEFVERLDFADTAIFAWDARGHGRSPGERGYADHFATVIRDIDTFARFIRDKHDIAFDNMAFLGHSVGAVAVAAWVHDYAPPVRAMILVTPAFAVNLYVPLAIPALRLRAKLPGKAFVKSYVRAGMLTHDPEQARLYDEDPLISKQIAVNILLDLQDTSSRLVQDAGAICAPTLVLTAGSDWVVKNGPAKKFFQRLSSSMKELADHPGFGHALLHETDRQQPIDTIRRFLVDAFDREPQTDTASNLTRYTQSEYDRLRKPLGPLNPKRWWFAMQRAGMKTGGMLSDGVRLGWQTGFDSGQSLDYIYQDKAGGRALLGRIIDRQYLNAIGWRGCRLRKQNLQTLLREALTKVVQSGQSPTLLDIASGPGRYTLELLNELRYDNLRAILRDRSTAALEAGRSLANEMGLENVTFAEGDAFSRASIAAVDPKPNIAIVSGLYELFPDNAMVEQSLLGMSDALQPGGYLLYTGQPWHPQIEMIARVLTNRDGEPWIMRRRTQMEIDELVRSAGFAKIETRTDPWGIFTVSVAKKTN